MILRLNGHDYYMEDAITNGINELWQNNIGVMEDDLLANDSIDGVNLDKPISVSYETIESDSTLIKVNCNIKNSWISLDMNQIDPLDRIGLFLLCPLNQHGNFQFDININATYRLYTDSLGVQIKRNDVFVDVNGLSCSSDRSIDGTTVLGIAAKIYVILREVVKNKLVHEIFPLEIENAFPEFRKLIDFSLFSESGSGIVDVNETQLVDDLVNSFILAPRFNVKSNASSGTSNINQLVIELDLLPGYGDIPTSYMDGEVTLPDSPSINLNGFSPVGNSYIYFPDNTLNWDEKIESTHDKMVEVGTSQIRIDAIWNFITPQIPTININEIPTAEELLDIINNRTDSSYGFNEDEKYGWNWLDKAITDATSKSIEPVVLLGYGLKGATPKYNGKHITPGMPYKNENGSILQDDTYIGVSEDVYKKWLEVITGAVVLKYKDDVQIWGAECELNAARYTESFGWWRKGDAWRSEEFQTDIVSMMYNTIKNYDPTSQVIQTFHIFEMAKRIDEWQNYYDIVGLNFYPKLFKARFAL